MLRITILICFLACISTVQGQDISGKWYGNFGQYGLTVKVEELVVEFEVYNDSLVRGFSYLYYSRRNYEQYVLEGSYRQSDSTLYFSEVSEIEVRPGTLNSNMMGTYAMKLKDLNGIVRFEGKWQENQTNGYRKQHSAVWLQKLPPIEEVKPVEVLEEAVELPPIPVAKTFKGPEVISVAPVAIQSDRLTTATIEADRQRNMLPPVSTFKRPDINQVATIAIQSNRLPTATIEADRQRNMLPPASTFKRPDINQVATIAIQSGRLPTATIEADRQRNMLPAASTFKRPDINQVATIAIQSNRLQTATIEADRQRSMLPPASTFVRAEFKTITPLAMSSQLHKADMSADRVRKKHSADTNLKRNTIIDKSIGIAGTEKDSVKIEIIDNAKIDDDIISIYINDSLVLHKQRISEVPVVLYVMLNKNIKIHTIKMAAESYGSMPPCTAHITVTANNQKYEFDLESYFYKNSGFTLRLNDDNE